MADDRRRHVAAIGGLRELDEASRAAAKDAGKAIGAELAKADFGLVAYFSNDESLEPHVVEGYVAALNGGAGEILVRYAESQRGKVRFKEEATRGEIFEHRMFPGQDWEAPFYRSLAEDEGVDAVLLVAGGKSTLIAGQIAVARRLPILAVDEFGGAATEIWRQLAQAAPDTKHFSWGTRPASYFVQQLKDACAAAAARREESRRRDLAFATMTARSRQIAYAAGAFVSLLVAVFFGMVYTPFPAAYPFVMFAGLIAAGATGALVRLILAGGGDGDPQRSLLLGSIAGFVVGVAYLIPQWVGAHGILEPKVDAVSATDKIQFVSAVLVAVSAGVGFDTVFRRLQEQAEKAPVGPAR